MYIFVRVCVRAGGHACVCARAGVRTCVPACVRTCACACISVNIIITPLSTMYVIMRSLLLPCALLHITNM